MKEKKRKIFEKTFGLLLADSGFEQDNIEVIFKCLLSATDITRFYSDNELIITVLNDIRREFKNDFSNEGLDKVIRYLENVRTGKFKTKEATNE